MNNRVSNSIEHVLSKTEMTVARLLAWGYIMKEIADMLHRSQQTIETHRKNIYRKLEIHKETDLCRWWIFYEYGIADTPFKKVVVCMFLLLSLTAIVKENDMVRAFRSAPMRPLARPVKPIRARRSVNWFDLPQLATA
jgi:DNA-binding CsgD family transcriptional regulator